MADRQRHHGELSSNARWERRLARAILLRVAAFAIPVGASVLTAALIVRALPPATAPSQTVLWTLMAITPATLVLWLVDRVARRLLPLAALLRLSMAFPDRAPSRYAVARLSNSTKELERRVADARAGTVHGEPIEAAVTILALVTALSAHDRRTRGHSERVRIFAELLGEEMGLTRSERDRLRWSALVHDIGKLTVSSRILNKTTKLSEHEWDVLRHHPEEGARLCAALLPWLGEQGRAIVEHHERYDGTGYPKGIAGAGISLAARILAVADTFEVMTTARAYKHPMSATEARIELARCAGTQFDPAVVRAFFNISLGRLRLAIGPLSWLAQWPFLSKIPQLGQSASHTGAALAGVAALGTASVLDPFIALGGERALEAQHKQELKEDGAEEASAAATSADGPVVGGASQEPPTADLDGWAQTRWDRPEDDSASALHADAAPEMRDPERPSPPDPGEGGEDSPSAPSAPSTGGERPEQDPDVSSDPSEGPKPGGDLADTIDDLTDTVEDVSRKSVGAVEDLGDDASDAVKEVVEDTSDTLDDAVNDTTGTLDDAVNDTTGTLDDAVKDTTGTLGGLTGR